MKLWIRISLLCACVLLFIVGICSLLLLAQARSSVLELTRETTQKQLSNICASVASMVNYYGKDDTYDPVAKRSLIKYSFSQFADPSFVLTSQTETLYSRTAVEPEKLVSDDHVFEGRYNGGDILVYGSEQALLGGNYTFYIIKDLSGVNNAVARMAWEFILISAVSIILGVLCIIILTRLAIRPLKALSAATGSIAGGEYGKRAIINSNDEIGTLARDFNAMAEAIEKQIMELKEIAERQRLFIGGLTHEFKTPITSMMIHSETLLSTKLSEEEAQRSLSHIYDRCRWLERLTQKLLKLITLHEEAKLKEEPVQKLFESICLDVGDVYKENKIELAASCETNHLFMDFDLMRSAVGNLLINAANASKPGQTVSLRAYGKTIEVRDNGKGIPKDEIGRVTEPFYMADRSRSKRKGGSGLGLALVKEIAEAHRAELIIESEQGRGTTAKIIFRDNDMLIY